MVLRRALLGLDVIGGVRGWSSLLLQACSTSRACPRRSALDDALNSLPVREPVLVAWLFMAELLPPPPALFHSCILTKLSKHCSLIIREICHPGFMLPPAVVSRWTHLCPFCGQEENRKKTAVERKKKTRMKRNICKEVSIGKCSSQALAEPGEGWLNGWHDMRRER